MLTANDKLDNEEWCKALELSEVELNLWKKKKKKKCFYFWLLSFSAVEEISQCMRNAQDEYSEMKQNHRRMYLILQPRADVYIYIREYIILRARGKVLESAVTGRQ